MNFISALIKWANYSGNEISRPYLALLFVYIRSKIVKHQWNSQKQRDFPSLVGKTTNTSLPSENSQMVLATPSEKLDYGTLTLKKLVLPEIHV